MRLVPGIGFRDRPRRAWVIGPASTSGKSSTSSTAIAEASRSSAATTRWFRERAVRIAQAIRRALPRGDRGVPCAAAAQAPIVYFVGTRPGWYRPVYPVFVTHDDPVAGHVVISPGARSAHSTTASQFCSKAWSSAVMRSARFERGFIRRVFGASSFRRIATAAPSVGSRRCASLMRPTSSETSNGKARQP